MAEQFIGVEVVVTLRHPPGLQLQGLVAGVSGQRLALQDVFFPDTGARLLEFQVDGSQIADLEVAPRSNGHSDVAAPTPLASTPPYRHVPPAIQPPSGHVQVPPPKPVQALADPAILSMGRKPPGPGNAGVSSVNTRPQELLGHAVKPSVATVSPSTPPQAVGVLAIQQELPSPSDGQPNAARSTIGAILTAPFNSADVHVETDDLDETDDARAAAKDPTSAPSMRSTGEPTEVVTSNAGKRSRRGGRVKAQKEGAAGADVAVAGAASAVAVRAADRNSTRKKGWRQSLASEPDTPEKRIPGVAAGLGGRQAVSTSNRQKRRNRAAAEYNDGWATEDATDIHGMGEFDFQGNLSKFDKKTVFSQIRAEDNTADEARLVDHNRLKPRAGTAGGKNLHHTENVLDVPNGVGKWNSEAGDSDEDENDVGLGSGRSSRRAMSRQSSKRVPSRKGSAVQAAGNAGALAAAHLGRGHNSSSHTASPRPKRFSPTGSPILASAASSKPSLRIYPSNRLCPVVNPLQMLDVERIAEVELGLTEDMMTENGGRGVAEVALSALDPAGQRLSKGNQNYMPVVIVLAGNNKSGARAVAGGRHLRNHGVRVMICVLGLEREEELLDVLRRQLKIFRSSGGKLSRWDGLAENLKLLESPPELVVDALLGMHISFEDLRTDDQATAYELIGWANKSKARVLAVDVPSGLDASTGEVSVLDGEPLHIRAKYVVAMGAPKTGVLCAMSDGEGQAWQLSVADIGISNTAWRKYGTRRRHGVEFASEWVVGLRYRAAGE
ncbi:MAG: enhancer of mRNA decapping [Thelocarpon impressellum]|nr:MAG: enhancer of mRNA decapping [Thelocarpon impressellum]